MKTPHVILLFVTLAVSCTSSSKRDVLKEAATIHNSAVELAEQLEDRLELLAADSTVPRDSLTALTSAIETWEDELVEVPGNEEHHHHEEGDHHHHHAPPANVTDEQMLVIQQELLRRIQMIEQRVDALKE